MGRRQGVTDEQLKELADFENSNAFGALEKLVLRYATAMSETPVEVSAELFRELNGHLNAQQLVELTSAIAWENYRARFDHAFGIESEGFSASAFCPSPMASGRARSDDPH